MTFILFEYFVLIKNDISSFACRIQFILMANTYYTNIYPSTCLIHSYNSLDFYFLLCFSLMQLRMCNPGRGEGATISSPYTLFTETHATNLTCACVLGRPSWNTSENLQKYGALLPAKCETMDWLVI